MKKSLIHIFSLIIILMLTGYTGAKDKYSVTVVPFNVNSPENIDYIKHGITDMLITRISVANKIDVTSKDIVQEELNKLNIKDITMKDVYAIGSKLRSDYVVWGSLTKIGSSISIDGKLTDIATRKSDVSFFNQSPSLDDLIPRINDFSQKIVQHLLGTAPQITVPAPAPTAAPVPAAPAASATQTASKESQIIAKMKSGKRGTLTSVINPDFIHAPDNVRSPGFWMSQHLPTEFKGMAVGDVNGDGLNEIVVIDNHNVYVYKKTDKELTLLAKITGKPYDTYLAVDAADINRNGIKEIFVTSISGKNLNSFALEYKDGKYVSIASNLRWFLRIIDTPSGSPLLMCQEMGTGDNFAFNTPIYEMVYRNGRYAHGEQLKIPLGLSIYGLTISNVISGGSEKIIALDGLDYLNIFEKTNKHLSRIFTFGFKSDDLLWRSDDVYGGSNNYLDNDEAETSRKGESKKIAYVNLRILTQDTNKDGKKEIIIVKNLSPTGRLLKNVKMFNAAEVHNLEWDGLGMSENWRTKKINGYIADYVIKDIDNDGKPEIVLAVALSVGTSIKSRSAIVAYKLDAEQ